MQRKNSPRTPRASLALAVSALTVGLGCQPALPAPGGSDSAGSPGVAHALLEPEAPFDAAPRVARVRIVPDEGAVADPSRVLFVRDHVGPGHVRQVEDADISEALADRVLPASVWSEGDGSIVIAPAAPLERGATYGVLSGDPPLGIDLQATTADLSPLLARVWPPPGAPGAPDAPGPEGGPFAILCREDGVSLANPPAEITLAPADTPATLTLGAAPGIAPWCLRIDLLDPSVYTPDAPLAVPPPTLTLADGSLVSLDPAPIQLAAALAPAPPPSVTPPLDCSPPAVPFGPGCALVADDRLFVTTPEVPLFWAVRDTDKGSSVVRATAPGEPWVLLGLTPESPLHLTVVALDPSGRSHAGALVSSTKSPQPHVVLTEVLANPLGAEPDQEWVEIYNDGLAPADLAQYTLVDIGGEALLPPAVLPPGMYALIVNAQFTPDGELDPAPSPDTLLLPVTKLGKDGLKNDGEPLKLRAPDGTIVSRFPAAPKPKPGFSVTRVSPSVPDGAPSSFAVSTPTPGAPYSKAP